jgi:hypothetical protein
MRFGLVTPDGLDTTIEAGFREAVGKVPWREEIAVVSGRLDDLWMVLREVEMPERDIAYVDRLARRRNGKWEAIAPVAKFVRHEAPVLYRGGALVESSIGEDKPRRKLVGIGLPPGVDAELLFPSDAETPIGLDSGEVVAPGVSGIYILGADGRRTRLDVPPNEDGSRATVHVGGRSRATLRVYTDDRSYRIDGDALVQDEILDGGPPSRFGSRRYTFASDGEVFENSSDLRNVERERKPAKVFECAPEPPPERPRSPLPWAKRSPDAYAPFYPALDGPCL